jgi:laminin alpha 1/2
LLNKANRLNAAADKKIQKLEKLKVDANAILVDSRDLSGSIQETIINLENYGTSDHHIKLPNALKDARMYYDDVVKQSENMPSNNDIEKCVKDQFEFWTDELNGATGQKERLEKFLQDQKIFHERLNDLKNLTHRVFRDSSETEAFITKNKKDFEKLKERVARLNEQSAEVDGILDENVVAQSASLMESVGDSIEKAKATNDDLQSLHGEVDRVMKERADGINQIRDKEVVEARKHAESLAERSKVIVDLFQNSKDGAEQAVRAGTVYENIVESINAARTAADKAHEAAVFSNEQLTPTDPNEETMMERGNDLSLESEAIQQDAEQQIEKIKGLW